MTSNYIFQVCGELAEDAIEEIANSKAFRAGVDRLISKYKGIKE